MMGNSLMEFRCGCIIKVSIYLEFCALKLKAKLVILALRNATYFSSNENENAVVLRLDISWLRFGIAINV